MPSSKLREVTSQSSVEQKNAVNSRDIFEAGKTMTGRRSTRVQDTAKLKVYNQDEVPDPWDDSDDEAEDDDDDEDDGEEEEEEEEDEETDLRAPDPFAAFSTPEDESIPEDDDEEFEEPRPLPANQAQSYPATRPASQQTKKTQGKPAAKPALVVTPAAGGPFKSVEEKEMEMENEEDDELSELDSNVEEEDQDVTNLDVEGDEDELGAEEDAEGDEDVDGEGGDGEGEIDSGDETPGSGTGTPKQQTKRQRGQDDGAFLALPMEPQIKKILTADEHRMRRAEMARRRKNLSEKKNEEEKVSRSIWPTIFRPLSVFLLTLIKMSTINRLLKRQVPKRRGKAMNPETLEAATAAEGASPAEVEEIEVERANPFFVRWVNDKDGSRIGVPEEWLGKKVGRLFSAPPPGSHKLVEEVA
jgi:Ino eighty subunit 2